MLDCSSCPELPVISARQVRVVFLGNHRYSGIALDPHLAPLVYRWREVAQCLHHHHVQYPRRAPKATLPCHRGRKPRSRAVKGALFYVEYFDVGSGTISVVSIVSGRVSNILTLNASAHLLGKKIHSLNRYEPALPFLLGKLSSKSPYALPCQVSDYACTRLQV